MKTLRGIFIGQSVLAAFLFTAGPLRAGQSAETPQIVNAKTEMRAVSGPLADAFRVIEAQAVTPEWVGYSVPEIAGDRTVCCGNYNDGYGSCGTCRLEKENGFTSKSSGNTAQKGTVELEGSRQLVVLLRLEAKQVTKVREASEDCTLDAGGLPFIWLTGVKPAESVALLTDFARKAMFEGHGEHEIGQGALSAIALHTGSSADRAFESFVTADQPEQLRKHASFWLGAARGKAGEALLQKMAKSDPSPEVRSQIAFALSVSHEPDALNEMIRMAREDESSHVRGQALFWLAQKAGQKAMGAITGAIENDPDTDVKKKAVFALSQMPKDEGVPKLIEVAKTNHNREVRKQAMFWLGQSNDPRALDFFEQILSR
ncbi:MAG TPA: HEAT repeat domain-containing protein [Candidatus Solibacter sp.]|nr:HEAT repeat domain-containing protein [Candidatus Solibacter sp.]